LTSSEERLHEVLLEARHLGFLGPGPVEPHVQHARGFAAAAEATLGRTPARFVDMGTGGGIPGLVLALTWSTAAGVFVESSARRCRALRDWLGGLDLERRVQVVEARAEEAARRDDLRESADVVTARGFAIPAATAEIGGAFVAVGGVLIVSEPPDEDQSRWPEPALAAMGLGVAVRQEIGGAHFVVMRKATQTPPDLPRGVGRPSKRPRW
jgi:16S rRNA (guanine527-N7)-methyltransferase